MILGLLFGIIAAIIAGFKGFKPFRWIIALGLIGFIVVMCLSSAKASGITPEEAQRRATKANSVGAWMAWINVGLGVIYLIIAAAVSS